MTPVSYRVFGQKCQRNILLNILHQEILNADWLTLEFSNVQLDRVTMAENVKVTVQYESSPSVGHTKGKERTSLTVYPPNFETPETPEVAELNGPVSTDPRGPARPHRLWNILHVCLFH